MKNLLFLAMFGALALNGCMGKEVPAELTLDGIFLEENETLSFHFYLTRPDLGLSYLDYLAEEMEVDYMSDLPSELRTYYVKVSGTDDRNPDSGTLCSDTSLVFSCEVTLKEYDQPYLIKITYENGNTSFTELTVPVPEFMETPTIVNPTEMPEQDSDFQLSFKDIGADEYEVWVSNCDEYNNDGINPCLDDDRYTISMESGAPQIVSYDGLEPYYKPSVGMVEGVITVKSNFKINFVESVEYKVTARIETETGFTTISDSVLFE